MSTRPSAAGSAWTVLLVLPMLLVLALATVAAVQWRRGELTRGRLEDALAALRGAKVVEPPPPPVVPEGTPREEAEVLLSLRAAEEEAEARRRAFETSRAVRSAQLARREEELARDLAEVQAATLRLEAIRQELEAGRQEERTRVEEARTRQERLFRTTLDILSTMRPEAIQSILMREDDDTAARYLRAMDGRLAGKVLAAFQQDANPLIQGRAQRLLQRIRSPEAAPGAAAGGMDAMGNGTR